MKKVSISHVLILNYNDLSRTNVKGKRLDNKAFNNLDGSRVLACDYGNNYFHYILGLVSNFIIEGSGDNKKLYCDFTFYDVNGFDTEMPDFIKDGIESNALIFKPLIIINKEVDGLITKADVLHVGLIATLR